MSDTLGTPQYPITRTKVNEWDARFKDMENDLASIQRGLKWTHSSVIAYNRFLCAAAVAIIILLVAIIIKIS